MMRFCPQTATSSRAALAAWRSTSAFTLIELSIVLVIIGLIAGGVLVGRDLIEAATLRAEISEVDKINTSAVTFKLKYNGLPGDLKNATQFFGATTQPERVTNGNGNGQIDRGVPSNGYIYSWQWDEREFRNVFDQLALAGLSNMSSYDETSNTTNRAGVGYPKCKYTSKGTHFRSSDGTPGEYECGMILSYEFNGHYIRLGAAPTDGGSYMQFYGGALKPEEAQRLDTKVDDGLPLSGAWQVGAQGYQASWSNNPAGWGEGRDLVTSVYGVGSACTTADFSAYNTSHASGLCSMRIKSGF